MHRKAASTTSDCAYLQVNLHKQVLYWNAAFPDGVRGASTRDVIDIDKSNFKLESQNQNFGKVTRERRCDARGKYKKGVGSVSLLMAISGDARVGEAFSFHRCFTEGDQICGASTISCRIYWIGWALIDLVGVSFLRWTI